MNVLVFSAPWCVNYFFITCSLFNTACACLKRMVMEVQECKDNTVESATTPTNSFSSQVNKVLFQFFFFCVIYDIFYLAGEFFLEFFLPLCVVVIK